MLDLAVKWHVSKYAYEKAEDFLAIPHPKGTKWEQKVIFPK